MRKPFHAFFVVSAITASFVMAGCGKSETSPEATSSFLPSGEQPTTVQQKETATENDDQVGNADENVAAENDAQDNPNAADRAAATEVFTRLSKLMAKEDYAAASTLMTQEGFDQMLFSRLMEAIMITSGIGPMPAQDLPVLKEYNLDSLPVSDFMGPSPDEKKLDDLQKNVLANFKSRNEKLQVLTQLDEELAASKPAGDMHMLEIDHFGGEVIAALESASGIILKVKPKLEFPGGGPPMPGGDAGFQLPEGAELIGPDGPPGDLPDGFPLPEGGPERMGMGELPSFYLKFRKDGDKWKWDGLDEERMASEFDGSGPSRDRPTIEDPEFSGEAFSGKTVSLKDYRGKLVLVDFWGTWCRPCVAELPKLKRIYEALRPHGFEIIGIAVDDEQTLNGFFSNRPLPWENIVDGKDGALARKFDVKVFPTTLLIDQEGNHVASNLRGGALVEELATRLNLDAETKQQLWNAILPSTADGGSAEAGDHEPNSEPGPDNQTSEHRQPGARPGFPPDGQLPRRMAIGFGVADANDDKRISTKEMHSYLAERLVGLDVPYDEVFARLDVDTDTFLDESEFSKRHSAIEHFVGAGIFGPGSMAEDPGRDYRFFVSTEQPVDDRKILGALIHRSQEMEPSNMQVRPDRIPKSHTGPIPVETNTHQSVERLVQATVIVVGNAGGFFSGGAVVVSSDGLAVTNYHIAESLSRGGLVAFTSDGRSHRVVEFLAGNRERDVALIRLEGNDFVSVPIAARTPAMGDDIAMMHHTENRYYTYDRGYVMRYPKVGPHPWMEISPDYAPGGSGCGIFNSRHELVGLVSMIKFGDGPTLAEEVPLEGPPSIPRRPGNGPEPGQGGARESEQGMLLVKHAVPLSAIRDLWQGE